MKQTERIPAFRSTAWAMIVGAMGLVAVVTSGPLAAHPSKSNATDTL